MALFDPGAHAPGFTLSRATRALSANAVLLRFSLKPRDAPVAPAAIHRHAAGQRTAPDSAASPVAISPFRPRRFRCAPRFRARAGSSEQRPDDRLKRQLLVGR